MSDKLKIALLFSFCILVLLVTGVFSFRTSFKYKSSNEWVSHTQEVIAETQNIMVDILDVETSLRGFVIGGENNFLTAYRKAGLHIDQSVHTVRVLTSDNPSQGLLLDTIKGLLDSKLAFSQQVALEREQHGFEKAQHLVSSDLGENLKNEIRSKIRVFINNEKVLFARRLNTANTNFLIILYSIVSAIVLAILIVLFTLVYFLKDYKRRLLSEARVAENEQRVKFFLESLPVGVFVLKSNGDAFYANSKSLEILGKGILPDTKSSNLAEVYSAYLAGTDTVYPADRLPIVRALNGEAHICAEDMELLKEGKRVPLRINATPIYNSKNEIEYAIAVFEDISLSKQTEQELIRAKKAAEESGKLKEAFLANMSHEIRTPMNAIIGFTDLLLKRKLAEPELDYVTTIKSSGETLLKIINDILDVSKMESGVITFETVPISIKEFFNSLNNMLASRATQKGVALSFAYASTFPKVLLGDATRLSQILINLIGNAIKFTEVGKVDIRAEVLFETESYFDIQFLIKDTGIGIPTDKLDSIFDRFTQAESHTTRFYGGTGLGLSIAKQLIELQGGTIAVKSKVGEGSEFTFSLRYEKSNLEQVKGNQQKVQHDYTLLAKKKILLVEDNPVNVKFVLSLLEAYNVKPAVAVNGQEALDMLRKERYDLVLMDIEMPVLNGYEATASIRAEFGKSIPIIAMTANAMSGEKEKCLQLGMNAYIPKPIREEALMDAIFQFDSQPAQEPTHEQDNPAFVNMAFLEKSLKNKEHIRQTLDLVLQQLPKDMIELKQAVGSSAYLTIKRSSHRIKSTVSLIGAQGLEKMLEEMEMLADSSSGLTKIIQLESQISVDFPKTMEELQSVKKQYV
jgi:signal transduction histidine kinase/DNA-binding response OmpR family regulator